MKINLYIERLVFDGMDIGSFTPAQMQEAIASELNVLLQTGELVFDSSAHVVALTGATLPTPERKACNDPAGLGQSIASAIYQGIEVLS